MSIEDHTDNEKDQSKDIGAEEILERLNRYLGLYDLKIPDTEHLEALRNGVPFMLSFMNIKHGRVNCSQYELDNFLKKFGRSLPTTCYSKKYAVMTNPELFREDKLYEAIETLEQEKQETKP